MKRIKSNERTLIFADGYSYTEILPVPESPNASEGNGFISIFHALFTDEKEPAVASISADSWHPKTS